MKFGNGEIASPSFFGLAMADGGKVRKRRIIQKEKIINEDMKEIDVEYMKS